MASYFFKGAEVFPSASIDLKVPRTEILSLTGKWADYLGYKSAGAISSTEFSYDDGAKTFLEHELGLADANLLMREKIPVWYWSSRLCRPFNLEEFTTAISPAGRVVSFEHSIENDLPLPSIQHSDARLLARSFVEERMKLPLNGYKPVEDGSVVQPHRTDHYFTWEDARQDFKGARLRAYVYVSGNKITAFNHFLYIPETWLRKFSELRSYNKALEAVAGIVYAVLNVATFFAFMWMFAKGAVRWRVALAVASVVAAVDYLESVNSTPNILRNYTTTMSYNGFVLDIYVSALWSAIGEFVQALMLAGAAEALYRSLYPAKVALEKVFTPEGLRCRQVFTGLVAGHAVFGIHLGWIIFYYLLGKPLHFWSPLEVRNVESLSTIAPFFSAMYIGVTAAVSEEFTYRVLGMSIFQKLVKSFWLANLLQALAWAFMHSNYPQEPAYARGVELTVVGLFYGFILRRYGLLPCLVSHFVFDTFLGVTPLMCSSLPGLQLSSFIAVCPFVLALIAGAFLIKRQGWGQEEALINAVIPVSAIPDAIEEVLPHSQYTYKPLSRRTRWLLAAVAVVAVLVEFGYKFPVVGQEARLAISREQALDRASLYLSNRKFKPSYRMQAAWLSRGIGAQELQEFQYLFEKLKFKKTAALANLPGHQLVWHVRFFRPLDPEEYMVSLDSSGQVVAFDLTRAEDAHGARLSPSQARAVAERYLSLEHPELRPFRFDSARCEERKARTDHILTYKVPRFDAPEAEFKVNVHLVGDLISGYEQYWDLPDKWIFERSRQTTKDQICGYVVAVLGLAIFVAALWWMVGIARARAIRWRPAIMLGLAMALLVIPQELNDICEFFVGYHTDTPLLTFFTVQGVRQIMTAVQMIGVVVGLAAFSLASFRLLFPRTHVSSILRVAVNNDGSQTSGAQSAFWLDAVLAGYAIGVGSQAWQLICGGVHSAISPVVTLAPLESLCALVNVSRPALDLIMDSFSRGVQSVLLAGIIAGIYAKYCKGIRAYLIFAMIVSVVYPCTQRYWQDYLIDVVLYFTWFAGIWVFLQKIARQNILAYFLAGAISIIAAGLRVLAAHGAAQFPQDVAILILVLASPPLYVIYLLCRNGQKVVQGPPLEL